MPIYAYKCTDCGHEKEVLQKISDAPLTDCPDCGQPSMAKQVTAAGFQLKGSGWYVTDFRNKDSGGKAAKPADPGSADAGASAATAAAAGAAAASTAAAASAPATGGHACGAGGCGSCA